MIGPFPARDAVDAAVPVLSPTRVGRVEASQRLDSLTGLRFFAALAVLLFHLPDFCGISLYGRSATGFGYLGVQFFFVLSGFVLIWTAQPGDAPRQFWRRRFARVYPLFLVSFAPAIILALAGKTDLAVTGVTLAIFLLLSWIPVSLSLSSITAPNGNPPGWSLTAEAFFYACFPAIAPVIRGMRARRLLLLGAVVFGLMVLVGAVAYTLNRSQDRDWLGYFPPYQIGFFLLGILLGEAVRRGAAFPPLRVVSAAFILVWLGGALLVHHHVGPVTDQLLMELATAPLFLLLIGSAATADLNGTPSPFRRRSLVTLGVWSYAIYLVQYPVCLVITTIQPGRIAPNQAVGTLAAVAIVGLVIGVAAAAHKLIEVPWNARLRQAPPSVISDQERLPDGEPGRGAEQ